MIRKNTPGPKPVPGQRLVRVYRASVAMAASLIIAAQPVTVHAAATETIWQRVSTMVKDVYGEIVTISTIVAVTAAAVALLIRMVSRNQRAIDEATSWLKRIVVTWIILNTLGFFVTYLQPLIQGGQYAG